MDTAKKSARKKTVSGAGGRVRTADLMITNHLLYLLSYASISGP